MLYISTENGTKIGASRTPESHIHYHGITLITDPKTTIIVGTKIKVEKNMGCRRNVGTYTIESITGRHIVVQ